MNTYYLSTVKCQQICLHTYLVIMTNLRTYMQYITFVTFTYVRIQCVLNCVSIMYVRMYATLMHSQVIVDDCSMLLHCLLDYPRTEVLFRCWLVVLWRAVLWNDHWTGEVLKCWNRLHTLCWAGTSGEPDGWTGSTTVPCDSSLLALVIVRGGITFVKKIHMNGQ